MDTNYRNSQTSNADKKFKNRWIYLIIIALLIGTNIYLYLQKDKSTPPNTALEERISVLDSARRDLQLEYNASLVRLDELTGKNTEMHNLLKTKETELSETRMRIQKILNKQTVNEQELQEAKRLIKNLNAEIDLYEKEIAVLKNENRQLSSTVETLTEDNEKLQEKIEIAKMLKATNIQLIPIDLRKRGKKEKETSKAKRVDVLRVIFDIQENKLTEDGEKKLLIIVKDPEGELLSNAALGSGIFITNEGIEKHYSLSKNIQLKSNETVNKITADWQQTSDYQKGEYQLYIYCDGYLIGAGSAVLR